jgi:group I intron endonuclease
MYGYIYKTTNLVNNKVYIGRKNGEFNPDYFGSGKLIKRALLKYGTDNFKVEFLASASSNDELNSLEIEYISKYRSLFPTGEMYNIADGGSFGLSWWTGKHRSKDEKRRISEKLKGRKQYSMTKAIRVKISNTLKGHIPWNKGKHPAYMQGKNHPMYGKHTTPWNKNKHHTKASNLKNRLAHLGKKASIQTRQKMKISAKLGWQKRKK